MDLTVCRNNTAFLVRLELPYQSSWPEEYVLALCCCFVNDNHKMNLTLLVLNSINISSHVPIIQLIYTLMALK